MRDTEFAEQRGKIDPAWRRIKKDIFDNKPAGEDLERWRVIELAVEQEELTRKMDEVGNPFFREYYMRDMLSDKAGPRKRCDEDEGRQGYFDLGEIITIHPPKGSAE